MVFNKLVTNTTLSLTSKTQIQKLSKVCEKWKSMAIRLHLDHFFPCISSCNTINQSVPDKSQLKLLLKIWRNERPDSYNVKELKTLLAQEVRLRSDILVEKMSCVKFSEYLVHK